MSWPEAIVWSVGLLCATFLLWRVGRYLGDW